MAEEIETSWPMGSMPTGTRLERPNTPRNRLGTFEPLARASAELLRHARRQIPEVDAEHLAVNGKVFTDLATSSRYRIARGFVDWTAIPEHVVAFACRDGYLVPFTLEDHRGRESAVYLGSMPTERRSAARRNGTIPATRRSTRGDGGGHAQEPQACQRRR